jgi:hypothetical protein
LKKGRGRLLYDLLKAQVHEILSGTQQLSQLAGVHLVALVALFQ